MSKINTSSNNKKFREFLVQVANQAKNSGIASLDELFEIIDDDFLKYALKLLIDGFPLEQVEKVLSMNVELIQKNHEANLKDLLYALPCIQKGQMPAEIIG